MSNTESILIEVNVYEKNLQLLIAEYERVHSNYINALRTKNIVESKVLLEKIKSLNQEIQSLTSEITNKINQMNEENIQERYKDEIGKKKDDLNSLNNKMRVDETRINNLLDDTIDLDGHNETLRLQHKSSMYYMSFYIIIFMIILILLVRMFISTEADPLENIALFLGILFLLYYFRDIIISSFTLPSFIKYDSTSFLYRMLN